MALSTAHVRLGQSLQFVASMTVCPSDIRKIVNHLTIAQSNLNPLSNVLYTPLFGHRGSLEMIHDMAQGGSRVFFDSGGYYVQIGRLRYDELYLPLLKAYSRERWASIYTLPDHVPTSSDNTEAVNQKVSDTVTFSTLFFQEMPDELKPKAMPVVQGRTLRHMDQCLDAYIRLGVSQIGFGSFGTSGKNNEINVATANSIDLAKYVVRAAHEHNIKVHIFGIGAPALIAMIAGIGADTFDSAAWIKAAGFGQVFLPFMRAYNISHQTAVSELQKGITFNDFRELVALTEHHCDLCEGQDEIQGKKMYRAVHNLIAVAETVKMLNDGELSKIKRIYALGSPRYRQEFERWLQ